jgi:hypothetical protein
LFRCFPCHRKSARDIVGDQESGSHLRYIMDTDQMCASHHGGSNRSGGREPGRHIAGFFILILVGGCRGQEGFP